MKICRKTLPWVNSLDLTWQKKLEKIYLYFLLLKVCLIMQWSLLIAPNVSRFTRYAYFKYEKTFIKLVSSKKFQDISKNAKIILSMQCKCSVGTRYDPVPHAGTALAQYGTSNMSNPWILELPSSKLETLNS